MQDTPARWVAIHRRHHEHADEQADPHSPLVNFLWAHMGWLIFKNSELTRLGADEPLRQGYPARSASMSWSNAQARWLCIVAASWLVFFAGGFIAELLLGGTPMQALQFGLSLLVWGVFVRTVLVWHITWSVNSVTHMWGYRNYETDESQPQQFVRRLSQRRRRLAQQPSRRPALRATRPYVVGDSM